MTCVEIIIHNLCDYCTQALSTSDRIYIYRDSFRSLHLNSFQTKPSKPIDALNIALNNSHGQYNMACNVSHLLFFVVPIWQV